MDCTSTIGLTIYDVPVKAGFWRSNNATNNIKACPVEKACVNSTCASGHEGPFCMVCSPGYSRWQRTGLCQPCPAEIGWGVVRSIASLVLIIALLVAFLKLNRKAPNGAIKPLINASQMIQVLLMFEADWPDSFSILVSIFGSINLDAVALASPTCMGIKFDYHRRLGTMIGATAAILIAPWVYAFAELRLHKYCQCRFCRFCCKRDDDEVDEDANTGARLRRGVTSEYHTTMEHCLRDTILVILLIHPTLSGYAFSFFNCRFVEQLGGQDKSNGRTGNWYMAADFSLRCYDETYNGMLVLAVFLVVLFVFGIPILFAFLLYRRRHKLEEPETKKLLGMLYSSYKHEAYWFESVQMAFKLALWASLALFKDDPQLKIAVALLVCFFQVALHAHLKPFNSLLKNIAQALGICTAFSVSFGGLVINYLKESMRNAYLLSNDELHAALNTKLEVFKILLEVVVYATLIGYGVLGVYWAATKWKKHEDRVRGKCEKYCKCLGIRSRSQRGSSVVEAAPSSVNGGGGGGEGEGRGTNDDNESKRGQRSIEMTDTVDVRRTRQQRTDGDLDGDETVPRRVWSFSRNESSGREEPRNFQMTNPLHGKEVAWEQS